MFEKIIVSYSLLCYTGTEVLIWVGAVALYSFLGILLLNSDSTQTVYTVLPGQTPTQKSQEWYSAFETWRHTVTHGRGSEGETGEWSG